MQMLQQGAMDAVPTADFVVTNPTHVACALKYVAEEMDSPMLIAKGTELIAKKIIDVRPTILKAINCKNYRKSPGLFKIAERLNVKIKGEQHNALNDAVLLYGVCRELNIQMSI